MEKLYNDFIHGEEIRAIKRFIADLGAVVITAAIFCLLILAIFLPVLTGCVAGLAVSILFATHFFRKWLRQP